MSRPGTRKSKRTFPDQVTRNTKTCYKNEMAVKGNLP